MEQIDLLRYAVQVLERLQIPYALVGSFASGIWGESRFTQDIDLLVDLRSTQVEALANAFPASDFYVSKDAASEAVARRSQFNVIHPASGNKIDFMIVGLSDWARAQLDRRIRVDVLPQFGADVAAPEDVILGKLIYFREGGSDKHLRDIAGILKISGDKLDRNYLGNIAVQLGVDAEWRTVLRRVEDDRDL